MKLAILGGSFDPVHNGHLFLADTVCNLAGYDRVVLVPASQSPFKPEVQRGTRHDRLAMLAASITGDPRITIDDCEIRRGEISYTIDTINEIIKRYCPSGKPGLVLGDDLVVGFSQWKQAEELAEKTNLIIARRTMNKLFDFPFPHQQLENDIVNISSTMIRERIQNGQSWRYLVPPATCAFIEERGLYKYKPFTTSFPPVFVAYMEEAVRLQMSTTRFLHSRNVALLCSDLCKRYGVDQNAGYLAGITHDICRDCSDTELSRYALYDKEDISPAEQEKPSLLHGRAGAVILRRRFMIRDTAVLEAVRLHTAGAPGMGALAKILYIADKIEVSRHGVDPALRVYAESATLDQLLEAILNSSIRYLRSQKQSVSSETISLLKSLHKNGKRN